MKKFLASILLCVCVSGLVETSLSGCGKQGDFCLSSDFSLCCDGLKCSGYSLTCTPE